MDGQLAQEVENVLRNDSEEVGTVVHMGVQFQRVVYC